MALPIIAQGKAQRQKPYRWNRGGRASNPESTKKKENKTKEKADLQKKKPAEEKSCDTP